MVAIGPLVKKKEKKKQGTSPTKIKKSKNKSRGQNRKWTFLKMSKNENLKIVLKKTLQKTLRDHTGHVFVSPMDPYVTIRKICIFGLFFWCGTQLL
jgi:hypothetical protein